MLTRIALVLALSLLPLDGVGSSSARASASCAKELMSAGLCNAQNSGTQVTVRGERSTPGTDTTTPGTRQSDSNSVPSAPPEETRFADCLSNWDNSLRCFLPTSPSSSADGVPPEEPALPPITMNELVSFAPDPVTVVGEPGGVGIAGMPTNFIAAASVHTQAGTIFGVPISVRFTPSGYDFHYGDGSSASTTSGGQTWAALGQAQFTPTRTSHVYRERGTYPTDVDVRYSAEVDLGDGWFPVAGELTTDGPARNIRIFEAHTALVAYTCAQRPSANGC